jgi:N-acetylneuraminic acid mutarotase
VSPNHRIPSPPAVALAGVLALASLGCSEDIQSPSSSPETSAAPSLELAVASNTWTSRAGMPGDRGSFAVGAAPNAAGQWIVYVFGGADEFDETGFNASAYNVATNSWSGVPNSFIDAANMNGVGRIGNRFYLTGGETFGDLDTDPRTFNTTRLYPLSTARLTTRANMPRATKWGVTEAIGGKLYVLPGFCSGRSTDPGHCTTSGPTRQLYRYDPATNRWTTRPQAPHFHTFGASAVINDKLYVVGGTGNPLVAALDVYDPATNTWQTRAPIPTPGERLFGAAIGAKFFVLSWSHPPGGSVVSKAFLYDPATNTWKSRAALPGGIAGPIVKVMLNGQPRLFFPGGFGPSYIYTP